MNAVPLKLGLAPALSVEETLRFGPLTIAPCGMSEQSEALRPLSERYSQERGAHPEQQAFVTCQSDLRALVPTIWSLFVFSCVTFARRQRNGRGVRHPENFFLLPVTEHNGDYVYETGHESGLGRAVDYPLRWPVDWRQTLCTGCWDRRLELACTLIARKAKKYETNNVVIAAGMAADLTCEALERRNKKVENVSTGARTYVLLGSAFEALHARGSTERHTHREVIYGVNRLNGASTGLDSTVFAECWVKGRAPDPTPGNKVTRPMFVTAQLINLRNTFAHGRAPSDDEYLLPPDVNNAHPLLAIPQLLAALISDDLAEELGFGTRSDIPGMTETATRLEVPFDLVHTAVQDHHGLLEYLKERIDPNRDAQLVRPTLEREGDGWKIPSEYNLHAHAHCPKCDDENRYVVTEEPTEPIHKNHQCEACGHSYSIRLVPPAWPPRPL